MCLRADGWTPLHPPTPDRSAAEFAKVAFELALQYRTPEPSNPITENFNLGILRNSPVDLTRMVP
jgi:hypothetical protein